MRFSKAITLVHSQCKRLNAATVAERTESTYVWRPLFVMTTRVKSASNTQLTDALKLNYFVSSLIFFFVCCKF